VKSGSNLERVLAAGEFAVTAEIGPPMDCNGEVVREKSRLLKGCADAFNITDCQTAVVRMSSIASAVIVMQEGLEPVIQMTCRDRNRIAMQADILGAAALGVRNCLCIAGDHQSFGAAGRLKGHPSAKNVYDVDSIQLISILKGLRDDGRQQGGDEIEMRPPLWIGGVWTPMGDPIDFRPWRLGKKVAAGVDFIQTQCIYNLDKFRKWIDGVVARGLHEKVKILAGVTPMKSVGMARYMKSSVPGMDVPDEIIARLKGAGKGNAAKEGIKICIETIQQLREMEGVAGVHVMAIEWEEKVAEMISGAGLMPRPEVADGDADSPSSAGTA